MCLLCSAFSIQQPKARAFCVSNKPPPSENANAPCTMQCGCCGKIMCQNCFVSLYTTLTQLLKAKRTTPEEKHIILSNKWYQFVTEALTSVEDDFRPKHFVIPLGHCCVFTQSIPTPWPIPNLIFPKAFYSELKPKSSYLSDSEQDYVPTPVMKKAARKNLRSYSNSNGACLDFLNLYHNTCHPATLCPRIPPQCPTEVSTQIRKSHLSRKRPIPDLSHHRYLGSLVMFQFGVVFLTQVDNNNLRTDIVALAKTKSCPPVWHYVIDLHASGIIQQQLGSTHLQKIPTNSWKPPVHISCCSPEDNNKHRYLDSSVCLY